jgi:DNA polymerase-4
VAATREIVTPSLRATHHASATEARKYGVYSAMGRSQPSREMPGFDFSEAAIDAYKAISLHIRQIFAEYTPIIEPLSLDEAYLDVTENLKGINSVIQICDGTGCLDQFPGRTSKGW